MLATWWMCGDEVIAGVEMGMEGAMRVTREESGHVGYIF